MSDLDEDPQGPISEVGDDPSVEAPRPESVDDPPTIASERKSATRPTTEEPEPEPVDQPTAEEPSIELTTDPKTEALRPVPEDGPPTIASRPKSGTQPTTEKPEPDQPDQPTTEERPTTEEPRTGLTADPTVGGTGPVPENEPPAVVPEPITEELAPESADDASIIVSVPGLAAQPTTTAEPGSEPTDDPPAEGPEPQPANQPSTDEELGPESTAETAAEGLGPVSEDGPPAEEPRPELANQAAAEGPRPEPKEEPLAVGPEPEADDDPPAEGIGPESTNDPPGVVPDPEASENSPTVGPGPEAGDQTATEEAGPESTGELLTVRPGPDSDDDIPAAEEHEQEAANEPPVQEPEQEENEPPAQEPEPELAEQPASEELALESTDNSLAEEPAEEDEGGESPEDERPPPHDNIYDPPPRRTYDDPEVEPALPILGRFGDGGTQAQALAQASAPWAEGAQRIWAPGGGETCATILEQLLKEGILEPQPRLTVSLEQWGTWKPNFLTDCDEARDNVLRAILVDGQPDDPMIPTATEVYGLFAVHKEEIRTSMKCAVDAMDELRAQAYGELRDTVHELEEGHQELLVKEAMKACRDLLAENTEMRDQVRLSKITTDSLLVQQGHLKDEIAKQSGLQDELTRMTQQRDIWRQRCDDRNRELLHMEQMKVYIAKKTSAQLEAVKKHAKEKQAALQESLADAIQERDGLRGHRSNLIDRLEAKDRELTRRLKDKTIEAQVASTDFEHLREQIQEKEKDMEDIQACVRDLEAELRQHKARDSDTNDPATLQLRALQKDMDLASFMNDGPGSCCISHAVPAGEPIKLALKVDELKHELRTKNAEVVGLKKKIGRLELTVADTERALEADARKIKKLQDELEAAAKNTAAAATADSPTSASSGGILGGLFRSGGSSRGVSGAASKTLSDKQVRELNELKSKEKGHLYEITRLERQLAANSAELDRVHGKLAEMEEERDHNRKLADSAEDDPVMMLDLHAKYDEIYFRNIELEAEHKALEAGRNEVVKKLDAAEARHEKALREMETLQGSSVARGQADAEMIRYLERRLGRREKIETYYVERLERLREEVRKLESDLQRSKDELSRYQQKALSASSPLPPRQLLPVSDRQPPGPALRGPRGPLAEPDMLIPSEPSSWGGPITIRSEWMRPWRPPHNNQQQQQQQQTAGSTTRAATAGAVAGEGRRTQQPIYTMLNILEILIGLLMQLPGNFEAVGLFLWSYALFAFFHVRERFYPTKRNKYARSLPPPPLRPIPDGDIVAVVLLVFTVITVLLHVSVSRERELWLGANTSRQRAYVVDLATQSPYSRWFPVEVDWRFVHHYRPPVPVPSMTSMPSIPSMPSMPSMSRWAPQLWTRLPRPHLDVGAWARSVTSFFSYFVHAMGQLLGAAVGREAAA